MPVILPGNKTWSPLFFPIKHLQLTQMRNTGNIPMEMNSVYQVMENPCCRAAFSVNT